MAEISTRLDKENWQPGKNGTLEFHVSGTISAAAAKAAAVADSDCPGAYEGLTRLDDDIRVTSNYLASGEVDLSSWKVVVPYGSRQMSEVQLTDDDSWWVLDFSYQQTRLHRSEDGLDVTYLPTSPGTTTPETVYGGFIDVEQEGGTQKPRGVDVDASALTLSGRWTVPSADVDLAYLQSIANLAANPVNSDAFTVAISGVSVTFAAGECRIGYIQTPANPRADGALEFNAQIYVSPNLTDGDLAGFENVTRKGWQSFWIKSGTKQHPTLPITVTDPQYLMVNTVYGTASYAPIKGV